LFSSVFVIGLTLLLLITYFTLALKMFRRAKRSKGSTRYTKLLNCDEHKSLTADGSAHQPERFAVGLSESYHIR